jgi:hypothetical protein
VKHCRNRRQQGNFGKRGHGIAVTSIAQGGAKQNNAPGSAGRLPDERKSGKFHAPK